MCDWGMDGGPKTVVLGTDWAMGQKEGSGGEPAELRAPVAGRTD